MSEDYYKTLPKKRMAASALIFNARGELLIVKPSYKDHWLIPGGVVEENESVRAACIREIKEEIGLEIPLLTFLCVDYTALVVGKGDSLQFIFHGGSLDDVQIKKIRIDEKEIVAFRFLTVEEAMAQLSAKLKKRVARGIDALRNHTALYLENGNIV